MPVGEVNELLDDAGELPEGEDWDTVGGLLYSLLGHVPTEGEAADVDGHHLVAERVQGRRIGRVRISMVGGAGLDERDEADERDPLRHLGGERNGTSGDSDVSL
jgi:magnesium and cobalt exporter, CNNM family